MLYLYFRVLTTILAIYKIHPFISYIYCFGIQLLAVDHLLTTADQMFNTGFNY